MTICKVIGHVWATKKEPTLCGYKLMVVQECQFTGAAPNPFVAADIVGAGIGETVLVITGSTARRALGQDNIPLDAAIVGIVDSLEILKDPKKE